VALTVAQAFNEFDGKLRPTTAQLQTISGRRESVHGYLTQSFGPTSNMPLLRTKVIGSASRTTIIRPIDDIDVMAVFDERQVWNTYQGNSRTFLYRIRDALAQYRVQVVGARGQAVRLFYQQPPHVDIAPVFDVAQHVGGGHVLPAGDGTWIRTDPDAHNAFLNRRNQELGGNLKTLTRMLKRWNRVHSNRLRAFHLEVMTQAVFRSLGTDMAEATTIFFQYAAQHLHVSDPAGHSGDLASGLTWSQEQAVLQSFATAVDHSRRAMDANNRGNVAEAMRQWRIVFGDEFPAYG
jgi:hypothetical protein